MKKPLKPDERPSISEELQSLLDKFGEDDVIEIGDYWPMKVVQAEHLSDYKILITFSDETQQVVDFGEFMMERLPALYSKYRNASRFKRFKIESGNIVWGRNWDLIFPIEQLYSGKIS